MKFSKAVMLGENKVEWSLTVDGQPVSLSAGIKGSLDNAGGSVRFLQTGINILTASVTDGLGRAFTYEQTITVYPIPCSCPPPDGAGLRPGYSDPGAGGPLRYVGSADGTGIYPVEWNGAAGKRTGR